MAPSNPVRRSYRRRPPPHRLQSHLVLRPVVSSSLSQPDPSSARALRDSPSESLNHADELASTPVSVPVKQSSGLSGPIPADPAGSASSRTSVLPSSARGLAEKTQPLPRFVPPRSATVPLPGPSQRQLLTSSVVGDWDLAPVQLPVSQLRGLVAPSRIAQLTQWLSGWKAVLTGEKSAGPGCAPPVILVLTGPSGSGKSTLVGSVANAVGMNLVPFICSVGGPSGGISPGTHPLARLVGLLERASALSRESGCPPACLHVSDWPSQLLAIPRSARRGLLRTSPLARTVFAPQLRVGSSSGLEADGDLSFSSAGLTHAERALSAVRSFQSALERVAAAGAAGTAAIPVILELTDFAVGGSPWRLLDPGSPSVREQLYQINLNPPTTAALVRVVRPYLGSALAQLARALARAAQGDFRRARTLARLVSTSRPAGDLTGLAAERPPKSFSVLGTVLHNVHRQLVGAGVGVGGREPTLRYAYHSRAWCPTEAPLGPLLTRMVDPVLAHRGQLSQQGLRDLLFANYLQFLDLDSDRVYTSGCARAARAAYQRAASRAVLQLLGLAEPHSPPRSLPPPVSRLITAGAAAWHNQRLRMPLQPGIALFPDPWTGLPLFRCAGGSLQSDPVRLIQRTVCRWGPDLDWTPTAGPRTSPLTLQRAAALLPVPLLPPLEVPRAIGYLLLSQRVATTGTRLAGWDSGVARQLHRASTVLAAVGVRHAQVPTETATSRHGRVMFRGPQTWKAVDTQAHAKTVLSTCWQAAAAPESVRTPFSGAGCSSVLGSDDILDPDPAPNLPPIQPPSRGRRGLTSEVSPDPSSSAETVVSAGSAARLSPTDFLLDYLPYLRRLCKGRSFHPWLAECQSELDSLVTFPPADSFNPESCHSEPG